MGGIDIYSMNLTDQGFCGYLARPCSASEDGVVVILGGESVMVPFLKLGKAMAKLFAQKGFTAVSVSLFGAVGLPDSPDGIPLEYTINAVNYLKQTEKCKRITVFGMSMGSIVALAAALHCSCVDNLIMMSPSHVAFEGVSKDRKVMKGRSMLNFNGEDIPYVSADFSGYKMYQAYEKAYADKERESAAMAALPIAEAKSRILLLAGEKDSSWPSAYSVRLLYDCLEKSAFPYEYKKILYLEYGHMLPLKKEVMSQVYSWIKKDEKKEYIMKRSLKYRILLKIFRLLPVKKIMALPPEKIQKIFKKADKGVDIPRLQDPELAVSRGEVNGSTVLYIKHKEKQAGLMIYLVGGGMLKHPKSSQAKEVLHLAKECEVDVLLPYYPTVFTGSTLPDVYEMLYALYKKALRKYKADDICFAGGSSGGNLALGLVSYINDRAEGLPLPGKIYAGSPGTLLLTDEERKRAEALEKTDVIMSVKATENIWDGMTGGKKVPEYMTYLQLGDYTGLKDVYLSFGGDEVFRAGAESIMKRLEEAGAHVTLEIAEGLYHSYAMMPIVKDAEEGYENFKAYIAE